jgi:hypothetical protein
MYSTICATVRWRFCLGSLNNSQSCRSERSPSSVTLHSNPGMPPVCFQSFSGISVHYPCIKIPDYCTKKPDKVDAEVCPGCKYKDAVMSFMCIGFIPGFECKQLGGFRNLCQKTASDIIFREFSAA